MPKKAARLLLACLCTGAFLWAWEERVEAEYIPPVTMPQLLKADFIAVGHFTGGPGKVEFVAQRILKGDAAAARAAILAESGDGGAIRFTPDGSMQILAVDGGINRMSRGGTRAVNAATDGLWFFSPTAGSPYRMSREPVELAEGFSALLAGKKPDLIFRMLQPLDFDLRREALEELVAHPDAAAVARLHAIALDRDAEESFDATATLVDTRLLDPEQFWKKWMNLPSAEMLRDALQRRDPARTMNELKGALAAERSGPRREALLILVPYNSPDKLDIALQYVDDADAQVRQRAVGMIWDRMWELNAQATSPEGRQQLEAIGKRVIPVLQARTKVETEPATVKRLTDMLANQDGVPWIMQIPRETLREPIPAYTEAAEFEVLIRQLTAGYGGGFATMTAGRELAERFADDAVYRMRRDAASPSFNSDIVYEGLGYVAQRQAFDALSTYAGYITAGDRNFPAVVTALGLQNRKESLAALKEFFQKHGNEHELELFDIALFNALGELSDPEALAFLKQLEPKVQPRTRLPYVRARARLGDAWAMEELVAAFQTPPTSKFFGKVLPARQDLANALCFVDSPEATAALRQFVAESWPKQGDWEGFPIAFSLQNYTGATRRSEPMAEIARRDPQWLADFSLQKMDSPIFAARTLGSLLFQQLTGQLGDYRADAFAPERAAPLKKLEAWWTAHKSDTRESWLLAYFSNKGFTMTHLDKDALPTLSKALESDFFTHNFAVEQISAICQKYFGEFPTQQSYLEPERTTTRVRGWLHARGFLAEGAVPK